MPRISSSWIYRRRKMAHLRLATHGRCLRVVRNKQGDHRSSADEQHNGQVVAIDVLSETRDISTDDSQASVVTAHPPPTSSDVGRAAPAKPNGTADANKSPVIHPCSIVAAHEEVEESSFMPSEYRSESDSAMRRWEKRDLIRQEDVNIGGGAFAAVFRVTKGLNGAKLAAKAILRSTPEHGLQDHYIFREIELLNVCAVHPNVVDLVGTLKTPSMVYLVMPLAATDVGKLLKDKGPLSEADAHPIVQQLISALEFVHGTRIIHRDIKPANLLLTSERNVLLADFGVAKRIGENQEDMTGTCGTKPYMSPEHMSRVAYSTQVDMWAAGVVTYEILHGRTPFCPKRYAEEVEGQVVDKPSGLARTVTIYDQADEDEEKRNILAGEYKIDPTRIGITGANFIQQLLQLIPDERMSARTASEHEWFGGMSAAISTRAFAAATIEQRLRNRAKEKSMRTKSFRRAKRKLVGVRSTRVKPSPT